jgi:hypothetical protein
MDATGDFGGWGGQASAMEIKPVLLAICGQIFLKSVCQSGGDTESTERQDHGTNTDVRLRTFANVPTPRTPKDRRADMSLGSNSLQHRIQAIAQLDDCNEGHARIPLGAQPLNHFRKPYSLRVAGGHI